MILVVLEMYLCFSEKSYSHYLIIKREKLGCVGKPFARFPDAVKAGILVAFCGFVHPFQRVVLKPLKLGPVGGGTNNLVLDANFLFSDKVCSI